VLYINGPTLLPDDLEATGATWLILSFVYTRWHLYRSWGWAVDAEDARLWTFRYADWSMNGGSWYQSTIDTAFAAHLNAWLARDPANRKVWISFGGDGYAGGSDSIYKVWADEGAAYVDALVDGLVAFMAESNVPISGVDIDYEDSAAIRTDNPSPYNGHDLLVQLASSFSNRSIPFSFAPQSPHLTATVYGGFVPVMARLHDLGITPYLFIQFYNNPDFAYCAYENPGGGYTIPQVLGYCVNGGLQRTVSGITYTLPAIPTDRLIVLKPSATWEAGSGFVASESLASCIGDLSRVGGFGLWRARPGGDSAIRALLEAVC
jgi:chitinase